MRLTLTFHPPRRAALDRALLRRLTRGLIELSGARLSTLALILTDDAESARLNKLLLNHDGPTDVITQSYAPLPHEPPGLFAELYVNLDRAWQVGQSATGVSPGHELLLYIAHGLDHLTGRDDATAAQRRAMRRRELGWIKKLGGLESFSMDLFHNPAWKADVPVRRTPAPG